MGEGRAGGTLDPLEGLPFQVEPLVTPIEDGISVQGSFPVGRPNGNGRVYPPSLIQREIRRMFERQLHPTEEFTARLFPDEGGQELLDRRVDSTLQSEIERALRKSLPQDTFVMGKPKIEEDGALTVQIKHRRPLAEKVERIVIDFTFTAEEPE